MDEWSIIETQHHENGVKGSLCCFNAKIIELQHHFNAF